ncbi:uncharacterized protein RJT21DRAFT_122369 [Scheffersomyces amazonensis]|uniref:uncharacterized protein n=1 Tax=Scheffersomyces amazonensis TaxID=1078765 RepID=UPI00315D55F6
MKVPVIFVALQVSLVLSLPNFFFPSQWSQTILLADEERLIKTSPTSYSIINESEKQSLRASNIKFVDVTNQISVQSAIEEGLLTRSNPKTYLQDLLWVNSKVNIESNDVAVYKYPTSLKNDIIVRKLYDQINLDLVYENLSKFTSFRSRYYKSKYGAESSSWLFDKLSEVIEPVSKTVTINKFKHAYWDQFSIIVVFPGKVSDKVVVGAHQDSINLLSPSWLPAPGADDDGSGTVTILESLRLLISAYESGDFQPYNTLEFHWYSAEEGGLLGSIDIFSNYSKSGEVVVGMLQQDMTGYTASTKSHNVEPHFGLITSNTSAPLNEFLKIVIDTYASIPYHETICGYGCSDHTSALENGYPATFVIESETLYTNGFIHTIFDTIEKIDFEHLKEHIKLTIAYAYELSLAENLY